MGLLVRIRVASAAGGRFTYNGFLLKIDERINRNYFRIFQKRFHGKTIGFQGSSLSNSSIDFTTRRCGCSHYLLSSSRECCNFTQVLYSFFLFPYCLLTTTIRKSLLPWNHPPLSTLSISLIYRTTSFAFFFFLLSSFISRIKYKIREKQLFLLFPVLEELFIENVLCRDELVDH